MNEQQTSFKTESPFVMDFDREEEFAPLVYKESLPAPKKRFFRQLLDLPKDMQEFRTSIQDSERIASEFLFRLDESDRKVTGLQEQLENLNRRSSTYQDKINPLVSQISEFKSQNQQIRDLTNSLKVTKLVMGIFVISNLALLGFVLMKWV